MSSLASTSLAAYLEQLASGSPTPGGGAAAAVTVAQAAALLGMVVNVTGEAATGADAATRERLVTALAELRVRTLALADADADAFAAVMKAYKLPKVTPAEIAARDERVQAALEGATKVPLEVLQVAVELHHHASAVVLLAKPTVVSDAGIALALLGAGQKAARYNVLVNLKYLKDDDFKTEAARRLKDLRRGLKPTRKGLAKRILEILGVLALCLVAGRAHASEVVYVGRTFFAIDAGKENELKVGDKVCVLDDVGEEVACGRIRSLKKHVCGIRPQPKEKLKDITKGMRVHSKNLVEKTKTKAAQAEVDAFVKAAKKHDEEEPSEPAPEPLSPAGSFIARPRVTIDYLYSAILPFQYSIPAYSLKQQTTGGSLWRSDRKVTSSKVGFELSGAIPVSDSVAIVPGLHYRSIQGDRLDVDWDPTNPNLYAEGATTATSEGLSVLAELGTSLGDGFALLGDGGLDVDESKVTFKATELGGAASTPIASITSSLTAISLRLGGKVAVLVGPVDVALGAAALLPFAGTPSGSASSPGLSKTATTSQAADSNTDLKNALNHKRSSFGAQVTLGVGIGF